MDALEYIKMKNKMQADTESNNLDIVEKFNPERAVEIVEKWIEKVNRKKE